MTDRPAVDVPENRDARVRRVVEGILLRRAQGEALSDEAICAEHPDLLPELASELRKLAVIQKARTQSQQLVPQSDPIAGDETTPFVARNASRNLSRSLHIRCPLCHEPFEIVVDQPLDDLHCSACQGRFSLARDVLDPNQKKGVTRIAHFELTERLGMGGFGTVWKAYDSKLDRTVALKIPRRGQLNADEVDEFLHEARVAGRLKHPNIVGVHEIGRDGDNVYIVSDLIDGVSLARFNDTKRLTQREVAELLVTICDALHFAHEQGIVHRDLKPGNILLDADGVPHITDFGLAKRSLDEVAITAEGDILGTPAYMSPEQARGQGHLADRRADVYAMGVILFELLTGHLPFRGSVTMLTYHAVHSDPPSPRSLNATLPRDLETICLKCLEKDPAKRYASSQELADELRRYLAGDAIAARPISATEYLWRWCRKNPRIPSLSAALLLVVAIAYGVAWLWFDSIYAASDAALTSRALQNLRFTTRSITSTAGNDLNQYFDAVEDAATDPRLIEQVQAMGQDADIQRMRGVLNDPSADETAAEPLRNELDRHMLRLRMQEWVEEQPLAGDMPVFAWFVMLPDGLQVARHPHAQGGEKTIGRNYSWRAYYHGGQSDHEDTWRASAGQHISTTQLSPAFVSRFTNEWVVVVSTPIRHRGQNEFLGVLGLMVRLGAFAKFPGSTEPASPLPDDAHSFAVLFDSRPPNPGQILQHPLYRELSAETAPGMSVSPRRQLLDQSQTPEFRVPVGDWMQDDRYRDPFAAAHVQYQERFLASKLPVQVRGRDSGLYVIVQESYDAIIGQALLQMRRGLILLSLATLGLVAAVVVPLWIIILRLVH